MSKKSFKENPALRFISAEPEPVPAAGPAPAARPAALKTPDAAPEPEGPVKLNPLYVETKSKRLQLLMQPSLHRRLKEAADGRGRSLNDLIHTVLGEWAEGDRTPGEIITRQRDK